MAATATFCAMAAGAEAEPPPSIHGRPAAALIAEFQTMCLSSAADRDTALGEAGKRGWTEVSPDRYAQGGETYIAARIGEDAAGKQLLLVHEKVGVISGLPIRSRTCTVMATVDEPRAVISFAEGLAGSVKPYFVDSAGREWIYAQTSGGPVEIQAQAFAIEVIRAGRFRQLSVSDQQTGDPAGNTALQITVGSAP
jgi:hypothetical protein